MKLHHFLVSIALLLALCAAPGSIACKSTANEQPSADASLKGWELYSWQPINAREWRFALLEGTNRVKTTTEIRTGKKPLRGLTALLEQLDQLKPGEFVFWCAPRAPGQPATSNDFPLPPGNLVDAVVAHAKERHIVLALP